MKIQNSLQYQITSKLKEELDIAEYDITELIGVIFKNCRMRSNSISGVRLSIGPVNPIIIPNFTSEKDAVVVRHNARSVVINFFISFSQICSF